MSRRVLILDDADLTLLISWGSVAKGVSEAQVDAPVLHDWEDDDEALAEKVRAVCGSAPEAATPAAHPHQGLPRRWWCESCQDHFDVPHYDGGDHKVGAEFGWTGEALAIRAKTPVLIDALRYITGDDVAGMDGHLRPEDVARDALKVWFEDVLGRDGDPA